MKIVHISDLHLGKKLHELSLYDEQKNFLEQITEITVRENADCVIIAGDVYDKSVPPADAVSLFDDFLSGLADRKIPVLIISGNHDSAERLSFGSRIMNNKGIYFSPVYNGEVEPVILSDEYGEVYFYMLPFIRPSAVRRFFEEEKINDYTDAVNAAINAMNVDFSRRNVIISHQFVTGASCCDSEEIFVGGLENVDSSVFDGFCYTALGHIHSPQNIGSEKIRYCGTPFKYSFSEASHNKSVTIAEIDKNGEVSITLIPLTPIHEMCEIKEKFEVIKTLKNSDDYMHITLTDEEDVPNALDKLRLKFSNLLLLDYDNTRTKAQSEILNVTETISKTPIEMFDDFYTMQNGFKMSEKQYSYIQTLIEEIWEGEE